MGGRNWDYFRPLRVNFPTGPIQAMKNNARTVLQCFNCVSEGQIKVTPFDCPFYGGSIVNGDWGSRPHTIHRLSKLLLTTFLLLQGTSGTRV